MPRNPALAARVAAGQLFGFVHRVPSSYKESQAVRLAGESKWSLYGLSQARVVVGLQLSGHKPHAGTRTWKESCVVLCQYCTANCPSKTVKRTAQNLRLVHLKDNSWFQFNDALVSFATVTNHPQISLLTTPTNIYFSFMLQ